MIFIHKVDLFWIMHTRVGELQISGFGGSKGWQKEVIVVLRLCETELNFYGTLTRLDSYLIFVSSLSFFLSHRVGIVAILSL